MQMVPAQMPEIGSREFFELASLASGMAPKMQPDSRSPDMLPQMPLLPPGMPADLLRMPGEAPEMPDLQEKAITLSVAQAVASFLQQQGVQVVLTRSEDRSCSLAERLSAVQTAQPATAFVSLHANASLSSQPEINGIETYHYPDSIQGGRLAWSIHKTLTRTPDITDRGVHAAPFALLALPIPAAQVEVGYITGKQDAPSLGNLAYHRFLGRAIANGILRFLRQQD